MWSFQSLRPNGSCITKRRSSRPKFWAARRTISASFATRQAFPINKGRSCRHPTSSRLRNRFSRGWDESAQRSSVRADLTPPKMRSYSAGNRCRSRIKFKLCQASIALRSRCDFSAASARKARLCGTPNCLMALGLTGVCDVTLGTSSLT